MKLVIFTRKGCCICETLKVNLNLINLKEINPNLMIEEIDIDRYDLYRDDYKKYDHLVPVLGLRNFDSNQIIELPPLSPRLKELQLRNWLQKHINNFLNKIS